MAVKPHSVQPDAQMVHLSLQCCPKVRPPSSGPHNAYRKMVTLGKNPGISPGNHPHGKDSPVAVLLTQVSPAIQRHLSVQSSSHPPRLAQAQPPRHLRGRSVGAHQIAGRNRAISNPDLYLVVTFHHTGDGRILQHLCPGTGQQQGVELVPHDRDHRLVRQGHFHRLQAGEGKAHAGRR